MLTQYEKNLVMLITYDILHPGVSTEKKSEDYLILWNELSNADKAKVKSTRQKELLKFAEESKKFF